MQSRIVVIGGGITGLAAAHRLREAHPEIEVVLCESSDRLGGVLKTTRSAGYLIEGAADNFLTTPPFAVGLCERVGLDDALISTNPNRRQALVVHRGALQPIPAGFVIMSPSRAWPILSSPVLSWRGKLRMFGEYFVPPRRDEQDESLASFVCRRFGREMFDSLVQPLVGGIYTGDPHKLSVDATMPRFRQMEREHGSLIRATLRARRQQKKVESSGGARYSQFVAPRDGMESLVQAIASTLPTDCVRLESPVLSLTRGERTHWQVEIGGPNAEQIDADGVILATPAYHAATLLAGVDPSLAKCLRGIEYASCAVVSLGYERQQIGDSLDGFGFVVPLNEQRTILSCSYSSIKYEGRAPDGQVLLRVFVGGVCQSGLLNLSSEQLIELAEREVSQLLHVKGQPNLRMVTRHRRSMPQYGVGHLDLVSRIRRDLEDHPALAIAGNSLNGVGVPGCIHSGEQAATAVAEQLGAESRQTLVSRGDF